MIAILFIVLGVTNDSGEIMITGVLVFWGEAGDTGIKDWEAYLDHLLRPKKRAHR
jgi:hypothetical protein